MKLNVAKLCLPFLGLVCLINASDSPSDNLRKFRFHPTKNSSCYQIYNSADNVDALTCRKPHKEYRRTCVVGLKDDEKYCGIFTPSGEMVKVPCTSPTFAPAADSPNFDVSFNCDSKTIQCYTVFKKGYNSRRLCPILVTDNAIGILTPDKYLILTESDLCKPFKSKIEIISDREFTSNFTFDPEERSCYQIYTTDQPISHHTCYEGNKIHKSCVHTWEKNDTKCDVVKSQNNETIILDCDEQTNMTVNCLEIYKDGNTTQACMEILEEGCVGITTPSGLRMLFACRTCGLDIYLPPKYNKEKLKRRRKFVKTYLKDEMEGKNSYYRSQFQLITDKYSRQTVYPYWLPGLNCYGMTLDTNETVILQCTDRNFSMPGCFEVTNPDGDKIEICASVYEENCVILETPKGKRIILACFDEVDDVKQSFVKDELKKYKNGIYGFHSASQEIKKLYRTDKIKNVCKKHVEDYQMQWLHEHQCWGVVTPDLETVLLECPNSEKNNKTGCFQVYTQNYGSDNQILPSSYEIYDTCIEIINDICVGVVTRKGWNLQLSCYFYPQGRCCGSKPKETSKE